MKIFNAIFTASLLSLASSALAGGFVATSDDLPRSFGPFTLGMSMQDFSRVTGIQPESCPICVQGENFATLDKNQLKRFANFDADAQSIDVFFYNNNLYHIAVAPQTTDIDMATDEYSQRFGSRGKLLKQRNGMVQLKWEDPTTLLTMNFRPEDNEVFSVNFYDWQLKQQREAREALMFENTANLNL